MTFYSVDLELNFFYRLYLLIWTKKKDINNKSKYFPLEINIFSEKKMRSLEVLLEAKLFMKLNHNFIMNNKDASTSVFLIYLLSLNIFVYFNIKQIFSMHIHFYT